MKFTIKWGLTLLAFQFVFAINVYPHIRSFIDTIPSLSGLRGEYLGQEKPGITPKLFAKGFISSDSLEHSAPAFSPDGKIVLWTVIHRFKPAMILEMRNINGEWTTPYSPSFARSDADDFYPSFSNDGKTLFFSSRRAAPKGYNEGIRIWKVERTVDGWGEPEPLDTVVSKGEDYAHSVAANGTIYFSIRREEGRIFDIVSAIKNGNTYFAPVPLGGDINTASYEDGPFIAPDESYLIFESGRPGGIGNSIDLYISFKQRDGSWSPVKNMGPAVNTKAAERFARVSPDGQWLFFGSNRDGSLFDIYWISTKVIDQLKQNTD